MPGSIGAGIKSINYYTGSISGAATGTVTISAVNTAKAMIQPLGQWSGSAASYSGVYYQLTNSTTVSLLTPTGSTINLNVSFCVVEYY